jgi:hypothetical protein
VTKLWVAEVLGRDDSLHLSQSIVVVGHAASLRRGPG